MSIIFYVDVCFFVCPCDFSSTVDISFVRARYLLHFAYANFRICFNLRLLVDYSAILVVDLFIFTKMFLKKKVLNVLKVPLLLKLKICIS
jgi:hypothetical protein